MAKAKGERSFSGPTPSTHFKPTVRSSKANLGNPKAKASDRSEMKPAKTPMATPHSGPEPLNKEVTKWHKKGFEMSLPTSMGGGTGRKKHRAIG